MKKYTQTQSIKLQCYSVSSCEIPDDGDESHRSTHAVRLAWTTSKMIVSVFVHCTHGKGLFPILERTSHTPRGSIAPSFFPLVPCFTRRFSRVLSTRIVRIVVFSYYDRQRDVLQSPILRRRMAQISFRSVPGGHVRLLVHKYGNVRDTLVVENDKKFTTLL